jgi:hypothetical protein
LIGQRSDDKLSRCFSPFPAIDTRGFTVVSHSENAAEPASGMPVRLRFIPFRRSELRRLLLAEDLLSPVAGAAFEEGSLRVDRVFADEFHRLRQRLKDCYAAHDPDADTRFPIAETPQSAQAGQQALEEQLAVLLNRANYERLTEQDLKRAFSSSSLFQIRLQVDLSAFDEVLLYCRGASQRSETISYFFGMIRREIHFTNYDRVALYLRFAETATAVDQFPGRTIIKLFQNVPDADLEMLFPNTRVAMRWVDRLLIGLPAVASGVVVVSTKLGAPLLLLGTLIGYWLGLSDDPAELDRGALLALGAGFAALGAYMWKQWSTYRNRKARFRQALTRDLYFKLLDNNAGVLLRVLDDAEDSECKESLTALYFLLATPEGLSAEALDQMIEHWFEERWSARLDFEIHDALEKLQQLELAREENGLWRAAFPSYEEDSVLASS